MGEHHADDGPRARSRSNVAVESRVTADDKAGEEPKSPPRRSRRRSRGTDWRAVRAGVVRMLSGGVRWVGLVLATVLVLHVIFVVGAGNPDNGIVSFVSEAAEVAVIGFKDLFVPEDPKLAVLLNYGIAAIFWLVASSIAVRIVRAVGGEDAAR